MAHRPVPDANVALIGPHGADQGALGVLATSAMADVQAADVVAHGADAALGPVLDALAGREVRRVYVHLDVDVLDAAWAPANEFALSGRLLPGHLRACIGKVTGRFTIPAAAVASYDPMYDREGRVLGAALEFLELVTSDCVRTAHSRPQQQPGAAWNRPENFRHTRYGADYP